MDYYVVYALLSLKDRHIYIGQTQNLIKRFRKHQKGKVKSTKSRCPFVVIHWELCSSREDAVEKEKLWKTTNGRRQIKKIATQTFPEYFANDQKV